jgi:hypothetical protein
MKQLRDTVLFITKDYLSKSMFADMQASVNKITEFTKETPDLKARFDGIE